MDFLTMQDNVKRMLQTDGLDYTKDVDIKAWLNEGYKEIITEIGGIERRFSDLSVSGQQGYAISSSIISTKSLKYDGVFLDMVDIDEFDNSSGTPTQYAIYGSYYYLNPIPATSGKTIILNCRTTNTGLSGNTDVPELPDYLHKYIVDYAVYNGKLKANDLGAYTNLLTLWHQLIKKSYGRNNKYKGVHKMKIRNW